MEIYLSAGARRRHEPILANQRIIFFTNKVSFNKLRKQKIFRAVAMHRWAFCSGKPFAYMGLIRNILKSAQVCLN